MNFSIGKRWFHHYQQSTGSECRPAICFWAFYLSSLKAMFEINLLNSFSTKFKNRFDGISGLWYYFNPNTSFAEFPINDCNICWNGLIINMSETPYYDIWFFNSLELHNNFSLRIQYQNNNFISLFLPLETWWLWFGCDYSQLAWKFDLRQARNSHRNFPLLLRFLHLNNRCKTQMK